MTPRVMLIIAANDLSGPAKNMFRLMSDLRARADFHVYNFAGPEICPFEIAARRRGIEVGLIPSRGGLPGALRHAVREARRLGIDIVQTHGFKPTVFGLFVKALAGARWICFLHGRTAENAKVRLYHAIDQAAQRWADRTVVVCEAQRCLVPGGADRRRVRVVYNAIDLHDPAPRSPTRDPVRAALGLDPADALVVVVGRLSPEKGVDVFLEALARIGHAETGRAVHGVLVGDGQEADALRRGAERLGVAARVHFTGVSTTPGDAIEQADLLVVPSRSEACPNVVLEAMALGTPVVSTRVGGVPELLRDGVDALLVPPDDPDALAAAMRRVLSDASLGAALAAAARGRARERFTPAARAETIWGLYRELLPKSAA